MKNPIYVVVRLEGGNITDVDASDPFVRVCVIDEDNIEAGDERPDEANADDYDYPVGELLRPIPMNAKQEEATGEHPANAE